MLPYAFPQLIRGRTGAASILCGIVPIGTSTMRIIIPRFAIALGLSGLCGMSPAAQDVSSQPQETFRSALDVVTIQASVRDRRGRVVSGLTTTDFEVRDNGEVRPILSLRSDRQSPLSLAILVDMSGSMGIGSKIAMARQAYDSLLSQLRQGQDEVALFTFDSTLHERQDFTRDLPTLRTRLSDFEPFGTTSLYDATAASARGSPPDPVLTRRSSCSRTDRY